MTRTSTFLLLSFLLLAPAASWSDQLPAPAGSAAPESGPTEEPRGFIGFRRIYEEHEGQGRLRIHSVTPGGPAEKAGLLKDDLIVAVNGAGFRFSTDLEKLEAFDWLRPGDRLDLAVLRGADRLTVGLVAGTMPRELVQVWRQLKKDARQSEQLRILRLLGRGGGIEITVAKSAPGSPLAFSAAGHPAKSFAYLEEYVRAVGPMMGEIFDRLEPGDRFTLQVDTEGSRLNVRMQQAPAYLEEFATSLSSKYTQK